MLVRWPIWFWVRGRWCSLVCAVDIGGGREVDGGVGMGGEWWGLVNVFSLQAT